jgi:hypothetical protein
MGPEAPPLCCPSLTSPDVPVVGRVTQKNHATRPSSQDQLFGERRYRISME